VAAAPECCVTAGAEPNGPPNAPPADDGASLVEANGVDEVDAGALEATTDRGNGVTLEPAPGGEAAGALVVADGDGAGFTNTWVAACEGAGAAGGGGGVLKVVERLDSTSPGRLTGFGAPGRLDAAMVAV
jgi:hypothetical protein